MRGLHGINGMAGAQIIAPKVTFGEAQLRGMLDHVRKSVAANGGQMPIPDPAGLLALGIVLDKLTEISDRMAVLEAKP